MKKIVSSLFAILVFAVFCFGQTAQEFLTRGNQFYKNKQYQEAVSSFSESIRLSPNSTEPWFNRAQSYFYMSRYDLAISDYTKALSINPNYDSALFQRGLAY